MSLSRKDLEEIVEKAFDAFEGFIKNATLTKPSVSSFNFSTGDVVSNPETLTVEVIPISTKLDSDSTIVAEFLAKRKDFNVSNYNTITIEADEYRIEDQELFDGVVVIKGRKSVNE